MRRRLALAALLGGVLTASGPGVALEPQKRLTQYMLESWQVEQGLPDPNVSSLVQTRDGYLWVGTNGGLCRFDGVRFTVFDTKSTPALRSDAVATLREGPDGSLWIGTGGGLAELRDGVFTDHSRGRPFGNLAVTTILTSVDGSLYVGVDGGGVFRLKDGKLRSFTTRDGLSSDAVSSIVEDGTGVLWIGTDRGLTRVSRAELARALDGKGRAEVTVLDTSRGLLSRSVRALVIDRDGALWIGTGKGLQRHMDGELTSYSIGEGLRSSIVNHLHVDPRGTVWAGTYGGGLSRLGAAGTFESLSTQDGILDDRVYAILDDREGSLWLGTGGGLNRLRDGQVTCVSTREGLTDNGLSSILVDREGAIWGTTFRHGLNRVKDGRVTTYTTANGLPSNETGHLVEDRHGTLLLFAGGLVSVRDGRVLPRTVVTKEGTRVPIDGPLLEDRHGDLWAGMPERGLARLAGGKDPATLLVDGLPPYKVLTLFEDRAGNVWIATRKGGIHRYAAGTLTTFAKKDGLPIEDPWSLFEDREGGLWIGTFESGLIRMKDGRFRLITTADGLVDPGFCDLVEDDRGGLWSCGIRGITRMDLDELIDVAEGRSKRVNQELFAGPEGIRFAGCAVGSGHSIARTKEGLMVFATVNGVVTIDPARIPRNAVPPPVLVEGLIVNGSPWPVPARGETAFLPAGLERLEIRYAALSYRVPRRVRFRHRLEGFDREWVEAGTERGVRYTNLAPRSYTFRVMACNEDGVWNEAGASISFRVPALVTQTWWFYVLVALGLVGVGIAAQRLRVSRLKQQREALQRVVEERTASLAERTRNLEVERERADAERLKAEAANRAKSVFLANMSHELRTPLNAVLGFAQLMGRRKGRDPEDLEHLAIIGRSGEHLLGLINDVLSLSKVEAGAVTVSAAPFAPSHLLKGITEMLRVRAEGKGLDLVFRQPVGFPNAVVGDEGKLRQILINLLGNAVKFTERGRVVFQATWKDGEARFVVEDSGPGLTAEERAGLFLPFVQAGTGSKAAEGTGLGLTISRSYARLMGGDIEVAGEPGMGCVFTLALPLPQADDEGVVARGRRDGRRVVRLAEGQRPFRVLVAEDALESRLLLTRLLRGAGFQVAEALNGEEAIRSFLSERPDLIFMDIRMPVMGGLEATQRIRQLEKDAGSGARVRIVALSASVLQHEQGEVLAVGFDGFLAKPFRDAAIFHKLGELLDVRYEYEGEEPAVPAVPADRVADALSAERLAGVSVSLRDRLRAAVAVGDDEEAGRVAEEIGREDAALGKALRTAVRELQLDRLMTLLERTTS